MTCKRVSQSVNAELTRLAPRGTGKLGLAVSGGSDSLALMLLAYDWSQQSGVGLNVATVDHGLRDEALDEASGVADICGSLDIPCSILTLGLANSAQRPTMARARTARHAALATWARANRLDRIALGHTQDDIHETMLMRIRAGSGWYGLPGLRAISPSPSWPHGLGLYLVRPLLGQTRQALQNWLTKRNISWVNDPSNANSGYERTRMRALTRTLTPSSRASLKRSAAYLARLHSARKSQLFSLCTDQTDWRNDGSARVERTVLKQLSAELQCAWIGIVALCVSGQASTLPNRALNALTARINAQDDGSATLGDAWLVWSRDHLHIYRRPFGEARSNGAPELDVQRLMRFNDISIWDGRFAIPHAVQDDMTPNRFQPLETARRHAQPPPRPSGHWDDNAARTLPVFPDSRGDLGFPPGWRAIHKDRMSFLLRLEADKG